MRIETNSESSQFDWPEPIDPTVDFGRPVSLIRVEDVTIPGADHAHQALVIKSTITEEQREQVRERNEQVRSLIAMTEKATGQKAPANVLEQLAKYEAFAEATDVYELIANCEVNGPISVEIFATQQEADEAVEEVLERVRQASEAEREIVTGALQDLTEGQTDPSFS